jgi:hypothetical protein
MNDVAASVIRLLRRVRDAISRSKRLVALTETHIAETRELVKKSRELTTGARAVLAQARRARLHTASNLMVPK